MNAEHVDYCTCCQRKLNSKTLVLLELDQRTDTYHNFGGVPENQSQGWFPFGPDCARAILEKTK